MILFTTDLDRTLIYSKRIMKQFPVTCEVTPVEQKGDEFVSFMTSHSLELLQQFHEKHLFIPVTTRALHVYERIHVFKTMINPKFAITSNGGILLNDGKQDMEWDQVIRKRLSTTSSPKEDMLRAFSAIRHKEWIDAEFHVDEFYYRFHVNKNYIPLSELQAFGEELRELGWRMFLNNNKLYILPYQLTKELAVSHLKNYVDYDIHVAAGDSLMDYDMLLQADIGFCPPHGELMERHGSDEKINWLHAKGATSTEELLTYLLEIKY